VLRSIFVLLAALQTASWTDPAPHRVQFVPVDGGTQVEVLDFGGTGRPIVLLAGLGATAHVFDDFAPRLTALGHVYAITRRGYGASSRPETGYDVARLGEDVFAVLNALQADKSLLIGHSYGGQELSYVAVEHPDRVAGLIYLEAAYRYAYDVPGDFEKDFPTLPPPPQTPPAVTRAPFTLPEAERRQPRGLPSTRDAIMSGGRQFTNIRQPTLAIFASPHDIGAAPDAAFDRFDEAMSERQARAVERGIPGSRVLRWPHASHDLFLTQPDDVLKEVTAFIASIP
jgi:non-heme chloroperoxidase